MVFSGLLQSSALAELSELQLKHNPHHFQVSEVPEYVAYW